MNITSDRCARPMAGLILAATLLAAPTTHGDVLSLYESGLVTGLDAGTGTFSYLGIDDGLVGINFDLPGHVAVHSMLGFMRASAPATLYGTIAPLDGVRPDLSGIGVDDVVLFEVDHTRGFSWPHGGPLPRVLSPGRYALVFGNGRFGTTGDVSVYADRDGIVAQTAEFPYTVFNSTNQQIFQNAPVALGLVGSALSAPQAGVRLLGPSTFADAATIDFETGTTGLPDVVGVSFLDTVVNDTQFFGGHAAFDSTFFGDQVFGNVSSVVFSDIGLAFDAPIAGLGFWVGQFDNFLNESAARVTFRALDAGGGLLYETPIDIPGVAQGPLFVGLSSDVPIARVEWIGGDSGFFAVDNVACIVPEPAIFGPMVMGVSALLGRRTRRAWASGQRSAWRRGPERVPSQPDA